MPGDEVRNADFDTGTVTRVDFIYEAEVMYNLTVDEAHTFFVGEGEWLVHNECWLPDGRLVTVPHGFRPSGVINPYDIRFSQSSVNFNFTERRYGTLEDYYRYVQGGGLPDDPIRLVDIEYRNYPHPDVGLADIDLYTLDNRRLLVHQMSGTDIPYIFATPDEIQAVAKPDRFSMVGRFTNHDLGISIGIDNVPKNSFIPETWINTGTPLNP